MYEEGKFIREQAAERYRRTHGYNLIAGKYYDDKKEEEFLRTREELETLQGRAQHHRLPPSIRYGEGNEYDIISKKVCWLTAPMCSLCLAKIDSVFRFSGKLAFR